MKKDFGQNDLDLIKKKVDDTNHGGGCYRHMRNAGGYILAVVLGAFLGGSLSFMINSTLVEISLSPFFSFYFGMIFIGVGALILFRVHSHPTFERRALLFVFSILVILSGFLCLFFDQKWFFVFGPPQKIPIYSLIGMSTCFAVAFSFLDLVNLCFPVIESMTQIYLLLTVSVCMGLGYGFIFGMYDVGKNVKTGQQLVIQLDHEELFSLPLGLILGGLGAGINEYLRRQQHSKAEEFKYSPLFQKDDDDDDDDNV